MPELQALKHSRAAGQRLSVSSRRAVSSCASHRSRGRRRSRGTSCGGGSPADNSITAAVGSVQAFDLLAVALDEQTRLAHAHLQLPRLAAHTLARRHQLLERLLVQRLDCT